MCEHACMQSGLCQVDSMGFKCSARFNVGPDGYKENVAVWTCFMALPFNISGSFIPIGKPLFKELLLLEMPYKDSPVDNFSSFLKKKKKKKIKICDP